MDTRVLRIPNERRWQGREDSNLRPSVLETDALTKLSYAPMRRTEFYPTLPRPPADPDSIAR